VDQIVAAFRHRIADSEQVIDAGAADPHPPTTAAQVDTAEEALGFAIPPILRRLYTEVANGGFGPGYGLVGGLRGSELAARGDGVVVRPGHAG
jgi:hypothetical protein